MNKRLILLLLAAVPGMVSPAFAGIAQQAYLKASNTIQYALFGDICPQLALVRDGSSYFVRFTGAPDVTYRLQRAPSVTGPWSALVTNTAPASGLIEYHETSPPPGGAFYRTAQP